MTSLPKTSSPSKMKTFRANLLLSYILLGALHEVSHIIAAIIAATPSNTSSQIWGAIVAANGGSICRLLFHIGIQRQVNIPTILDERCMFWIRHTGWIFSTALFITLAHWFARTSASSDDRKLRNPHHKAQSTILQALVTNNSAVYAAAIVAIEAVSTDLLGFHPLLPLISDPSVATALPFFCGNFGVILLHHNWLSHNHGEAALEVLERMVRVTMMRGAQSGGVVTYYPSTATSSSNTGNAQKTPGDLVGIRCRVVNKKRTNLSKLVRAKVDKDILDKPNRFPGSGFVPVMSGHTRFATTSISTLDGTHPHIWTPPTMRRVYDMTKSIRAYAKEGPVANRRVENYITHNGDFDFYSVKGINYDLDVVQAWLQSVTHAPMPSTVDSCAVAGMVDVLRTQGCFGLSARYALALGLPNSVISDSQSNGFPEYKFFEQVGIIFEKSLKEYVSNDDTMMDLDTDVGRNDLAQNICEKIKKDDAVLGVLLDFVEPDDINNTKQIQMMADGGNDDDGNRLATLTDFCRATIGAFFDNDLFYTTKTFLSSAKGSFGLVVSSSLDARRQICIAAQGQSMSIAFYPSKGLICFGSEQAAVKSGLNTRLPGDRSLESSTRDVDLDSLRLDLDDLGGEIVLLDWKAKVDRETRPKRTAAVIPSRFEDSHGSSNDGNSSHILSMPNRHLARHSMLNGDVTLVTFRLDKSVGQADTLVQLFHRMTALSRNALIKPLKDDCEDPILEDINEIPAVCRKIQDEFQVSKAHTSLNRLAAYNLSSCLRHRLKAKLEGKSSGSIDILLTGCEVSLWLAEQFGSDLQKAFPKLKIQSVSSNKLLGLFGQEISLPSFGFPYSPQTQDLSDTIIIIVSQSGGTFAPLNCSNLLQGSTDNLFVVTSEWDTQIGKQLRSIDGSNGVSLESALKHRIFTTEVGMRPAEPSSISVVATHQLLTNLLEYLSAVILSDNRYRRITGTRMTEQDLQILERCNQSNVSALADIVGIDEKGEPVPVEGAESTDTILRNAGNLWAEHILENARAYIMCFIYVFVTVISGYPLATAIAYGAGLDSSSDFMYLIRLVDAAIYFWLPQINITLIRLYQGRNLLHRMVGRTVVIGDIPWVAQSAEAFLSKIFACSYSIAGLNVLSGNAVDHLVHRHTHRVVRGALVICGRPDGRLSALSTAEASTCLAVNQASSIQSWGGTCESITIGHNPFKLPLTKAAIFLKRRRPLFLCERILLEADIRNVSEKSLATSLDATDHGSTSAWFSTKRRSSSMGDSETVRGRISKVIGRKSLLSGSKRVLEDRAELHNNSIHPGAMKKRSAVALLGAYSNLEDGSGKKKNLRNSMSIGDNDDANEPSQSLHMASLSLSKHQNIVLGHTTGSRIRSLQRPSIGHPPASTTLLTSQEEVSTLRDGVDLDFVLRKIRQKKKYSDQLQKLFSALDVDKKGFLEESDFLQLPKHINIKLAEERLHEIFKEADEDKTGKMDYSEMVTILAKYNIGDDALILPPSNRDETGIIRIEASKERYFGFNLRKFNAGKSKDTVDFSVAKSQHFAQELYETRIASLQRFVAMTVMFHQMGKRVQKFFEIISFGWWGYRMDRTHSIMRIATTASPVSGADVREQMKYIRLEKKLQKSINTISGAYLRHKDRKEAARIKGLEKKAMRVMDDEDKHLDQPNIPTRK